MLSNTALGWISSLDIVQHCIVSLLMWSNGKRMKWKSKMQRNEIYMKFVPAVVYTIAMN